MTTIVELRGVNKAFGPVQVLKGVNLTVTKGEVLVIIGASGSGKSTLIRCVNGLEAFQEGSIVVDGCELPCEADRQVGEDQKLMGVRRGVGMVFQQFNLFPHKSVLENVALAPMRVKNRKKEDAEAAGLRLGMRTITWTRQSTSPIQRYLISK